MINASQFVPMFGVSPHTPGLCREKDANVEQDAKPRPKKRRRQTPIGPCPTCGGGIKEGSIFVCASCHAVAPDKAAKVGRHVLPALEYDARYGDGLEKQREKAKADAKAAKRKEVRLTAKQRKALLRDAKAGEHPLPIVEAFLLSQAG
jgi:hypothetical protein